MLAPNLKTQTQKEYPMDYIDLTEAACLQPTQEPFSPELSPSKLILGNASGPTWGLPPGHTRLSTDQTP